MELFESVWAWILTPIGMIITAIVVWNWDCLFTTT
jgi:hypothetical protein